MISWPISGHIVFLPWCCFKELHEKPQWGTWLVLSLKYIKALHVTCRMPPSPALSLVPLCNPSDQLSVFIYRLNALTQHQVSSAARSALVVSHWDSVRSSSEGAVGDLHIHKHKHVTEGSRHEPGGQHFFLSSFSSDGATCSSVCVWCLKSEFHFLPFT